MRPHTSVHKGTTKEPKRFSPHRKHHIQVTLEELVRKRKTWERRAERARAFKKLKDNEKRRARERRRERRRIKIFLRQIEQVCERGTVMC